MPKPPISPPRKGMDDETSIDLACGSRHWNVRRATRWRRHRPLSGLRGIEVTVRSVALSALSESILLEAAARRPLSDADGLFAGLLPQAVAECSLPLPAVWTGHVLPQTKSGSALSAVAEVVFVRSL